jgi:hypothetical protein
MTFLARQPDPDVVRKVTQTRAAQGLPPTVEDPAALERAAAALRAMVIDPDQRGRRPAA